MNVHSLMIPSHLDSSLNKYFPYPGTSFDSDNSEPAMKRSRNEILLDRVKEENDEDENTNTINEQILWGPVTGVNMKILNFTAQNVGINGKIRQHYAAKSPSDFFCLFITDEIIDLMVTETNRYAEQQLNNPLLEPNARLRRWKDTTSEEIKQFLGILLWMELVRYPRIEDYWSTKKIYSNKITAIMARNRYQLLSSNWHFYNNADSCGISKLQKLSPFLEKLKLRYQDAMVPDKDVCIDETFIPFKGRPLAFRQYVKSERYKAGIKLVKLCTLRGYTYNLSIYCGKEHDSVVQNLMCNLVGKGYTLYTDSYYTSVELAHILLAQKTHLVGHLREDCKYNPKEILDTQLDKGSIISRESNTGIVISKWNDKKDVLTLSTKHDDEMLDVQLRDKIVKRPRVVVDYNAAKSFLDLPDQMKGYNNFSSRRGAKWYRKLAIALIFGATIVNAHIIFSNVTKNKMGITKFKEQLCEQLLSIGESDEIIIPPNSDLNHILEETNARRRCVECYKNISEEFGRKKAQSKSPSTKLKCTICEKHYCLACFFEVHKFAK